MELSKRFEEALVFAARLHARQTRKGGEIPYISHLMAVCAIVLEHGGNEDEAIAALLHDAVEDQGGSSVRLEIQQRFGETVVAIVDGCSDSDTVPKPPWQARKEAYIAHLSTASPSILLVSAADKLHNANAILNDYRTLGEDLWQRFKGGKAGTLWYYQSLLAVYKQRNATPLVTELEGTLNELEHLIEKTSQHAPTS